MSTPDAILAAMWAVLDNDERLARAGVSSVARTQRLFHARTVLRAWTVGDLTSEEAELELGAVLRLAWGKPSDRRTATGGSGVPS
jgi:hypothetical protein